MKKLLLSFIFFFLAIVSQAQITPTSGIVYVKQAATGTGNGSSWTNATSYLELAIDATGVTQVWVASGTYQLANGISYKMKNNVAIYGGFAGVETQLSARNWLTNVTILRGNNASVIRNIFTVGDPLLNTAILDGFTVTGGMATYGGGVYNYKASPTITNVIINGNQGNDFGGGIYNEDSSPILTNLKISGNYGGDYGGGIYNENSSPLLTNLTISGNYASFDGGGIFNSRSSIEIRNSIIFGNNKGVKDYLPRSTSTYTNSLVQGLTDNNNGNISAGSFTASDIFTSPLAPTKTTAGDYTLKTGSPAINAGNNTDNATTTDLAGNIRIQKALIDLGAYESDLYPAPNPDANGIVYVKAATAGNGDGKSWTNATSYLQAAIDATGVTQVWVAAGTHQLAANTSYVMKNGVAIYGGFAGTETVLSARNWTTNVTILRGNNSSVIRNSFTASDPLLASAILNGFTLTDGNAIGTTGISGFGGGVYNLNASPTLINLNINGNMAKGGGANPGGVAGVGAGGGVYNENSSPIITNTNIRGNQATGGQGDGGSLGASIGGGVYNINSSPILTNVIISGNSAYVGLGGDANGSGMYNVSSSPWLTNVTITGNAYARNASGMYNKSSSFPKIRNSIIIGNASEIYNETGSIPEIKNSLVKGNVDFTNGNINASSYSNSSVFTSPQSPGLTIAGDYTLKANSPGINAGNESLFDAGLNPDLSTITIDLAGYARLQNGKIDLGAYESAFFPAPKPDANGIVYVKTATTGNGNGKSWADASSDLQAAINAAGVNQVWIASGSYQLANGISYIMKNGVAIYGGFAGTETAISARNLTSNVTTLQGNNASVIKNNFTSANPLNNTAILDGFTITGGYSKGIDGAPYGFGSQYAGGTAEGGGIYNVNASPTLINLIIISNKVKGGTTGGAGLGGGMYNKDSSPMMTNIIIRGNSVDGGNGSINSPLSIGVGHGGGLHNDNSSPVLTNVTISGNYASTTAGGVYNNNSSAPIIKNTVIYGNNTGITNANSSTPVISFSLVQDLTDVTNGNISSAGITVAQIFTSPQAAGLSTAGDYMLKLGSPAIGVGNNIYNTTATDLGGNTRVQKTTIDLGAYESAFYPAPKPDANGIVYVKTATAGNGDGKSWTNATSYLQVAINATGVNQVWVASGTYQLGNGTSYIMKNGVAIYGGFADSGTPTMTDRNFTTHSTTLKGDGSASVIRNNFTSQQPLLSSAILDGFIVTGGDFVQGGGINNNYSSPVLSNITISGNNATLTGGGIYNNYSSPALINVSISGNNAQNGGGIYNNYSLPISTNVSISGNNSRYGGGIYNNSSSVVLTNVTISGNNATLSNGGSIYNIDSSPQIRNGIVFGNNTGIKNFNPTVDIPVYTNSLVQDLTDTSNGNISSGTLTANDIFTSPLAPGLNSGGNYTLKATSSAINKGNNTFNTTTLDLAGKTRIVSSSIDLGAYEVQSQPQTITATNLTATYGDGVIEPSATASSGLVVSYASADNSIAEAYQDAADGNNWKIKILKAGITTVIVSQAGGSGFDAATSANITLQINAKTLTVQAEDKVKTFGSADPALTYVATGLLGTDAITGNLSRTTGEVMGTYAINQGTLSAGSNYAINFTGANLVISPKTLTIQVDAKTKTFGSADPALTFTVIGLPAGEVLTGSLVRAAGENAGTYAINKGSLSSSSNYIINFKGGNLLISPKILIIQAEDKVKTYGTSDPALTYTVTGLLGTDALIGNLSRATGENAGNYAITTGTLSAGANYSINLSPVNFVINKAVLTVKANNVARCIGAVNPSLTLTYTGFVGSDNASSLSTLPLTSTTANTTSVAGKYPITVSGGTSTNYTFVFQQGDLIVNALPIVAITTPTTNLSKGLTINLTASGGTSYVWTDANGIISGQRTAVLTIRPTINTTYTVTATNSSGCSQSASISITILEDYLALEPSNLMTLNGDGINDFFIVKNIDLYPNNVLRIFDRTGKILYTKKVYDNSWNGTVNGNQLDNGTYYYIIDFGKEGKTQKGFITIIRN